MGQFAVILSLLSVVIAAASLAFAILSFCKSHEIERRHIAIEEARRAEEQSAHLVAQFHQDGNRRVLRISNQGNGTARNVKVVLDGRPIVEHPCYVKSQNKISTISGLNYADYLLSLTMSAPIPSEAAVYWEDDFGKRNHSINSLTL